MLVLNLHRLPTLLHCAQNPWHRSEQDAEVVEDGGSGLLEVPQKQVCHVKAKKCPKDNIVRHWRACAKKTGFKFLASTGDVLMGQLSGVKQSLEDCAKDKKGTEALLWRSSTGKCYKVADVNKKDIMQKPGSPVSWVPCILWFVHIGQESE